MAKVMKWQTVGGVKAGKETHQVVAMDLETDEVRTMNVRHRWFYCKQCELPEQTGGIYRPEALRTNTRTCVVLAVGTGCGKYYKLTKEQKEMVDMTSSVALGVKPYDKILIKVYGDSERQSHPWGLKRSPFRLDEDFFVHECIALAVIEE